MGEYYRIVNTDSQEWIDPDDFGEPIKLGGLMRSNFLGILAYLLAESKNSYLDNEENAFAGAWRHESVVVVGDTHPLHSTVEDDDTYTHISNQFAAEYNRFAQEQLLQYCPS